MKKLEGTIVFVTKDNKVLLAKKTRKIGVGKWNGYGGNFEPDLDKDFKDCACREFQEESGGASIKKDWLEKLGVIVFHNGPKFEFTVHVYKSHNLEGEPQETDEMIEATWFEIDNLPPGEEFMESDQHWIPRILKGEKMHAHVWYDGEFRLTDRGVEIELLDYIED